MSSSVRDDPFNIVDISPEEAVDDYLQSMQGDNAQGTIDSHSSRLSFFIKFCDEKGIESIADLHPKHIQRYRNWRLELYDLKTITLKTNMDTIRVFIRWCANTRYCHPNLEDAVPSVETTRGDTIDETWLEPEHGEMIKEYLRKYHYGSEEHAIFELFWSVGIRLCSIHSIDVDDVDFEDKYVELEHRPESETTLKNGEDSERVVGLPDKVIDAVQAWVENPDRPDVTDDYGRRPLISTKNGRRHKNGIREIVNGLTRPCTYLGECPVENKDPETCKAASDRTRAYECPESVPPHAARKGVATRQIKAGIDPELISERMDCSVKVLWEWYSRLTPEEEMERRREPFDEEYE